MANTFNEKELLPDRTSLALCHVEKGAHGWVVEAVGPEADAPAGAISNRLKTLKRQMYGRASAVKLIDDLAGASPASASFPVGTVVISGDGAGDQTVESPAVEILAGCVQMRSDPSGG